MEDETKSHILFSALFVCVIVSVGMSYFINEQRIVLKKENENLKEYNTNLKNMIINNDLNSQEKLAAKILEKQKVTWTGAYFPDLNGILIKIEDRFNSISDKEVCSIFFHELGHRIGNNNFDNGSENFANNFENDNAWRCGGLSGS